MAVLQGRSTRYAYIVLTLLTTDRHGATSDAVVDRDENGMDIFRPYLKSNPFRGDEIYPNPSPDIQPPIPYPYPNTQIAYL